VSATQEGTTEMTAPTSIERMALHYEISDFLFREADLLDERRYTEWLAMLADDYQYSVPMRMNVKYDDVDSLEQTRAGAEVCWFDEPKDTVEMRVTQLQTGVHWAEEPVSRVSHLVTNIRLDEISLPEVEVSCRFLVYRNRVADETDFLVGRRRDRLRKVGDDWQVCRRTLLLDQSVLLAKNLSIFV
jgi:3-phenylpropionate/cinnamic acid dioxygenase small subunit